MQERRHRPATAADFHRLADLAKARGLRLFRDGSRWYCSSASRPGEAHYVTGLSCDCQGFIAHQRCTHHALLLERLGWLPELEEGHTTALDRIFDTVDAGAASSAHTALERVQFLVNTGHDRIQAEEIVAFELGLIGPDTIVPALPAPADCPECTGCGVVVYRTFEERCPACGGSGITPDHRLAGAPAIRPIAA
jgi:hypothetical protein